MVQTALIATFFIRESYIYTRAHSFTKEESNVGRKKKSKTIQAADKTVAVLFILALITIFLVLANTQPRVSTELEQEQLLDKLIDENPNDNIAPIVIGRELNVHSLAIYTQKDYEEIKRELDVDADFVLYFEDENGNIVPILDRPCFGSSYGRVSGQQCH